MQNIPFMTFDQTSFACTFRPCGSANTSFLGPEKHEASWKYCHRYSEEPRMITSTTDASEMVNTNEEVFASNGTVSRNGHLHSCGKNQILDENYEVINAHEDKQKNTHGERKMLHLHKRGVAFENRTRIFKKHGCWSFASPQNLETASNRLKRFVE